MKLKNMVTILNTLKDLPESDQKPFRDALMITSENDWHDLVHLTDTSDIIDLNEESHTWYREDDLAQEGYFHESVIPAMAIGDIEGLCVQLAKEKEPQTIIAIETLHKLYEAKGYLSKNETDLIKAILNENGYEV